MTEEIKQKLVELANNLGISYDEVEYAFKKAFLETERSLKSKAEQLKKVTTQPKEGGLIIPPTPPKCSDTAPAPAVPPS